MKFILPHKTYVQLSIISITKHYVTETHIGQQNRFYCMFPHKNMQECNNSIN